MHKIGVIMSTYNGAKYIRLQLDTIINQSHQNLCVNISDDSSTDETLAIVKEIASADSRVIYKKNSVNVGVNKSFQEAIRSAPVADFYCLADQDDIWPLTRLENFVGASGVFSDLDGDQAVPTLFVCQYETFQKSILEKGSSSADLLHLNRKDIDWKSRLLAGNSLYGCCFFFNHALRLLIQEVPKGRTTHDYWIALVAAYTGRIIILPFTGTFYRQHANNASYGAPSSKLMIKLRRANRSLKEDIRSRPDMNRLFSQLIEQHARRLEEIDLYRVGMAAKAYQRGKIYLLIFQLTQRAWRVNLSSNILRSVACVAESLGMKA